jgi:hypothetical protein
MRLVDRFKYVSHKYMRWFGGVAVTLSFGCAVAASIAVSVQWSILAFVGIALVGFVAARANGGLLASGFDILLAMLATQVGVLKAIRGDRVVTWQPAASR